MPQNATPFYSTPPRSDAASQELQLIRQERNLLQQECNRLVQQVDVLIALQQTTQQQLTQAQQMLHEMQHRYDRLLEAPRSVPASRARTPRVRSPEEPAPPARSAYDPDAAAVRIHVLQAQGQSFRQIATQLNAEGVPTRRGGPWGPSSIRYLLKTYGQ
jgi:hypothetical protein